MIFNLTYCAYLQRDVTWLPTLGQPLRLPCFTVQSHQDTIARISSIEIIESSQEEPQGDLYQNVAEMQQENEYMNVARDPQVR